MENQTKNTGMRTSFTIGQLVRLDKKYANSSKVKVVRQTPNKLFTTVTSNGVDDWQVMTNRLTEL